MPQDGRNAIHVAAEKGRVELLRFLVSRGVDLNGQNVVGRGVDLVWCLS